MQELQSFEWQLKRSPIMNVLFTPETVPLTPAPLAWPSKLNSRTYLPPPPVSSPQRVSNNANILQTNSGVANRHLEVPQPVVNSPNYLNMQVPNQNSLQQPTPAIQKNKAYISPSLRVNKLVQNNDGIDVRIDKSSDGSLSSISNPMVNRTPLDSLQVFDESNETEILGPTSKMIQQNSMPSEQKNKEAAKRQFAVDVLYQKQTNDIQNGKTKNEFKLLNNGENLNVKLPIMNQVDEKQSKTNFQDNQDMKTAPTETSDGKNAESLAKMAN